VFIMPALAEKMIYKRHRLAIIRHRPTNISN